jgi:hypothetical protein
MPSWFAQTLQSFHRLAGGGSTLPEVSRESWTSFRYLPHMSQCSFIREYLLKLSSLRVQHCTLTNGRSAYPRLLLLDSQRRCRRIRYFLRERKVKALGESMDDIETEITPLLSAQEITKMSSATILVFLSCRSNIAGSGGIAG